MSWARIDDRFHQNKKMVSLSDQAFRLYVCALTFCCSEKNGGKMSRSEAMMVARMHRVRPEKTIAELLQAGCWNLEDDSYLIHNFLKFNPTDPTAAIRMRKFRTQRNGTVTKTEQQREESVTDIEQNRNGNANALHPIPSHPNYESPNPLGLRYAKKPAWDFLDVLTDTEELVRVRRADGSIWAYEMGRWLEEATGARSA